MKIPLTPPNFEKEMNKMIRSEIGFNTDLIKPTIKEGEYIHWDKLRHLESPEGLSSEQWWVHIKLARKATYKKLPFVDKGGRSFVYALTEVVLNKLHQIDRKAGYYGKKINTELRNDYLVRSLVEEAITSSQLEGASTTRKVAKEMLKTQRKPRDISEQMIYNNYLAMKYIRDNKDDKLTDKMVLELHRILTIDTMENPNDAGRIRKSNDVFVWDNTDQVLHEPPDYRELDWRLKDLCDFANKDESQDQFIHPVVKAIILHFMLAYDHPFADGNGRTARALFYWSLAHQDYLLMEYISISRILKLSPAKYAKAYLYTETDENDLTYYLLHQLDTIIDGIVSLEKFIDKKNQEATEIEVLLYDNNTLRNELNFRQISLIKHALKHPNTQYKIEYHRQSHNVTYDTARTDLLKLARLGLLKQIRVGRAFVFMAQENLKEVINGI